MQDVKIQISCRCRECNGNGVVSSHADLWNEYAQWQKGWLDKNPRPVDDAGQEKHFAYIVANHKAEDNWWAERGFGGGCEHWPPEKTQCDACEGSGRERTEIDLATLAALMSEAQRPLVASR